MDLTTTTHKKESPSRDPVKLARWNMTSRMRGHPDEELAKLEQQATMRLEVIAKVRAERREQRATAAQRRAEKLAELLKDMGPEELREQAERLRQAMEGVIA